MSKLQLKEWHRTVILILLIVFAIGFIFWSRGQYSTNFVNTF
jgi:hypothetical protein